MNGGSPRSAGPGQDVGQAGVATRLDDEGDALVAVEPGERRQRAAFDLDDRDAQARGVQDDLLERRPALGHDQQSMRRATGDERLLDRAATGDELLVLGERLGRRQRRAVRGVRVGAIRVRPPATRWPAARPGPPGRRSGPDREGAPGGPGAGRPVGGQPSGRGPYGRGPGGRPPGGPARYGRSSRR